MPKFLLLLALFAADASTPRWSPAEYAGMFTHPDLDEVSGLAASRSHPGLYWAHNDGGNGTKLVAIRADGSRVATLEAYGVGNVDW
jgi:hypothetical protein